MNNLRIKKTIVCKDIDEYRIDSDICDTFIPQAGDVAIFEILEIGYHTTLQSVSKLRVFLVEGDYIMAGFGNRYASEQFEGYIPDKVKKKLDILAIGGVIGVVKSKHTLLKYIEPTKVRLIGYVVDETGKVINTKNYSVKRIPFTGVVPNTAIVILSVGSTMDSGKTTAAAFCTRGLKTTGKKVAYIKLTGTIHTKDKDFVYDCGADVTLDFSDVGFPSTYMCDKEEILDLYQTLLVMLEREKPDYIVIEIADGLIERETDFLLRSKRFMSTIDHVIFSGNDSLAVFFGIEHLGKLGISVAAVSGRFSMSPLLIEEVKLKTTVPVLTIEELMSGEYIKLFQGKR